MNRRTGFRASYHRASPALATFLLVLLSGWSPRNAAASAPPDGEEEAGGDQDDEQPEEQPDEGEPPAVEDLAERIGDLERRLADSEAAAAEKRPVVTVSGYVDSGFFAPQGSGSGVVQDVGPPQSRHFPEYANKFAWVFLGDLLSTAVNSRGDPADLGNLPGVNRQDTIRSGGTPSFIVNEVNLTTQASVGSQALAT